MNTEFSHIISRRLFLQAAAGVASTAMLRPAPSRAASVDERRIRPTPSQAQFNGPDDLQTAVWAYDGTVPGPTLRLRQGEPVRIVVENGLDENTTVHWHGIRLQNSMDGVTGLTQPPIKPGESFVYEFTPPDAGTFWYHPHANSLEQLGRGQIAAGFGNMMEAGMSGRVGSTVTLNGTVPADQVVRAGERIRLRLLNSSLARVMGLRFEGHDPLIIARDGQPCDPHALQDGRLLLGPAMRVDLLVDMLGEPGRSYRITDDFYLGLGYELTRLTYSDAPALRTKAPDPVRLPANPLPEPDLVAAERSELTLEGGMMSHTAADDMKTGMQGMPGMGSMSGMVRAVWSINGTSMTGDGHAGMTPLFALASGKSYVVTIRNRTAWWHPMHLHGFSFRVLTRNGAAVPHSQWADTVLLAPEDVVEIASSRTIPETGCSTAM